MNKIYLLFTICIFTFSCTNNDEPTEEVFVPDPTIISEYHEFDHNGKIKFKYLFDDNGRITESIYLNQEITSNKYKFDSNNQLINTKKYDSSGELLKNTDIVYNTDGKVLSIGDRTFSYNPDMTNYVSHEDYHFSDGSNNFYIEDNTYYNDGEPKFFPEYSEYSEQEISFDYFIENSEGYVTSGCTNYEVIIEYPNKLIFEGCNYDFIRRNDNNNLIEKIYYGGESISTYKHDSAINPLFQGETNLLKIAAFFNSNYIDILLSINNEINSGYAPESPEHNEYIYEFNEHDLPITKTREAFYLGAKEYEYQIAKYYYQGDEIPE